ncbi:hypothetical protein L6164_029438 [Bauhinia variegata]|uniref:Uncharacterized protein n=1 Tax=Bauhinia variegata TaxID=167791 RepID=A0ACB9L9T3_BAUVA|nr:hypothetical protein L6164_029438 [Bauhinia variegata]
MAGGGQFIKLLSVSSSPSSVAKPSRSFFYNSIMLHVFQRYGQATKGNNSHLMKERAPSTAEEFERVAEEKAKEANQGIASQTTDEASDVGEETTGDSKVESVKERYKEHEPGADYRRRG